MSRGRFVVLEGIEGAGKSTHTALLVRWLEGRGIRVVAAREPGGTALGERLRNILLDPHVTDLTADAELLLMFAARSALIREVILPALEAESWVLCDRFVDSSYAYQAYGRGLPAAHVEELEKQILGELRPELTILLDAPVEVGFSRKGGEEDSDRFERESREFFERIRTGYLERAAAGGERYRIVDASRPMAEVSAELKAILKDFMVQSNS